MANTEAKSTIPAQPVVKEGGSRSSARVVIAVVVGVVLLALLVVARNHNSSSSTTATTTPSASTSATSATKAAAAPTKSATTAAPAQSASAASTVTNAADAAPVGIVAHFTATGATIYWKAPASAQGLTSYNVEVASNGGAFKLIATVPATQLSLNVTKNSADGWESFKVSAVYSDGKSVAGTVFGLPGQYA